MAIFYARHGGRFAGVIRNPFGRYPEPRVADLLSGPLLAAVRGPVPILATLETPAWLGRSSLAIGSRLLLGRLRSLRTVLLDCRPTILFRQDFLV